MTRTEVALEHVLTFTAYTTRPALIAGGPQGTRGVIAVTGGDFEGPRLRGTIAAPGGDWVTVRANGVMKLDVRLLLVTDDGTNILMTYSGTARRHEAGMDICTAPLFEAPEGEHAWLNDIQCLGFGELFDGGVTYEVYAVRG
ncbi:MAG: DUF3237 domain-containing protein [Acidobacteriota bacterium]|nr:DUF3237 domain-containing protein [Acidobacteriota bacterium]